MTTYSANRLCQRAREPLHKSFVPSTLRSSYRLRTNDNPGLKPVLLMALCAAFLVGCASVGPDYQPPPSTPPTAWYGTASQGPSEQGADTATLASWWDAFHDPMLTELVTRTMAENRDLRQAQARLREARARRGLAEAERFPTLTAQGAANRSRGSDEAGGRGIGELYALDFDAGWELDLFGGQRRAVEATRAEAEASEADLQDVLISLLAETALNYLELRSAQTRLGVAEKNLLTQQESHDLARWRFEAGLATRLDVEQALTDLEQTRAQIPLLRAGLTQAGNRLAVLLGRHPDALRELATTPGAIPQTTAQVAVGIPAEVLRRRPDVRRAERQLAAQTARIGVAEAARYPGLSLLGTIGLESLTAADLLGASARTFSLGSNAAWTLFDAGRIRRNIDIQTALQEQALAGYEKTVLAALAEVEDRLAAYAEEQNRRAALHAAAASATGALELARNQYAAGLIDFQRVLDTQRSLLGIQDQLAGSETQVSSNLVRLYKALGGGWTPVAPALPPSPSSENMP